MPQYGPPQGMPQQPQGITTAGQGIDPRMMSQAGEGGLPSQMDMSGAGAGGVGQGMQDLSQTAMDMMMKQAMQERMMENMFKGQGPQNNPGDWQFAGGNGGMVKPQPDFIKNIQGY